MFNNLIESESHREELARKSRFFLGTLVFYALLFSICGVASIYAYDAHLENQSLEIVAMLPPVVPTAPPAETRNDDRAAVRQPTNPASRVDIRRELILDTNRPIAPDTVSAVGSNTPPVRDNIPVAIGPENVNAGNITGPVGPPSNGNGAPRVVPPTVVKDVTEPPPSRPAPTPTPAPQNIVKSLGAVTGQMLNKPNLPYPPLAKTTGIQGPVTVQVLIDETGKVISAHAISGHPMLRAAAEQAAYQARFSPTLLSNQPIKASGTITFNFQLQK